MTDQAEATVAPALEMRGITKRYPAVVANDNVNLSIRPGEIHALLGENGAGKSTLMNILYGLARPDEGEILLDGVPVRIADPADAIARGISMVHQHFMLVPVLTVAENILLGEETMAGPVFLDRAEAHKRIVELGRRFGFEIDPGRESGPCRLAGSSGSRSSRRCTATPESWSSTSPRRSSRRRRPRRSLGSSSASPRRAAASSSSATSSTRSSRSPTASRSCDAAASSVRDSPRRPTRTTWPSSWLAVRSS